MFEKGKTDERIPLFLWPSAMAGFEEDEEDAGPSYHRAGQSSHLCSGNRDIFVQAPLLLIQL